MIKLIKGYFKYKLKSRLQIKLLDLTVQKYLYFEKAKDEGKRSFNKCKCSVRDTEESFEKDKQEKISWFYQEARMIDKKCEIVEEIIKMLEEI